ncbi:MAG: hypothetical protein DLM63_10225 [Solirubrobacterales bacterium]|nr:MAG: hypothetical protein DLM63_10225 [Solirubrobacterales bacterium]
MTVAADLRSDLAAAMKAGERERVGALRLVLSELQKAAKDAGDGVPDEIAVLRRERKRREEAASTYREAGRQELAEQEEFEAGLIDGYLPAELPDDQLEQIARTAVTDSGAAGPADMGRAMKAAMAAVAGRADGRRVSTAVRRALES